MRRFVLFLFPTLIALVSAGLLVAARRTEPLKRLMTRIDWPKAIVSREREIAEVPS